MQFLGKNGELIHSRKYMIGCDIWKEMKAVLHPIIAESCKGYPQKNMSEIVNFLFARTTNSSLIFQSIICLWFIHYIYFQE